MRGRWIRRAYGVFALLFATSLATAAETPAGPSESGARVRTPALGYSDANAPRRGRFLVASRKTVGPFFYQTVVVLLTYEPDGAVGLVINRPTQLPVSALVPSVAELQERTDPALFGGPVEPNRMMVLVESKTEPTESLRVIGDVYASRSLDSLQAMATANGPSLRFRAYVGYAGWGPGQLDAEIARGDWHVDSGDAKAIFDTPNDEIWPKFIKRNTGIQTRVLQRPHISARVLLRSRISPLWNEKTERGVLGVLGYASGAAFRFLVPEHESARPRYAPFTPETLHPRNPPR